MKKEEATAMISVNEMREYLLKEYGIKNDAELNRALRELGGIKIGIFTDDITEKAQVSKD